MPGPILRNYKNGSIIYFESEKSDHIYILQRGRVVLISKSLDGKEESTEDAKLGEFFGVRSALGRFPREETAQVVGGAAVLVFKTGEFELFISQKPNLMMKMMKVFSNQLRQYHYKVREKLGQHKDTKSPAQELMNVGEVYHKIGEKEHAWYAYTKYIENFPNGPHIERAKQLLEIAQKGGDYPLEMDPMAGESEGNIPTQSKESINIREVYVNAEKLISEKDFQSSIPLLKTLAGENSSNMEEVKLIEAASFLLGEALEQTGKTEDAISAYTHFPTKFPESPKVKEAIFHLAELTEKTDIEKAISLYKKVSTLPPEDSFTERAQKKLNELKG